MKDEFYEGLKVRVQLIREGTALEYHKPIICSEDVVSLIGPRLEAADREVFLSILLTIRNVPIGVEEVAIGSQNASIIHPREIFRSAILSGRASSLILAHNHPSGSPDPSAEDRTITKRLKEAGELLGIKILDHLIIGHGSPFSFADQGEL